MLCFAVFMLQAGRLAKDFVVLSSFFSLFFHFQFIFHSFAVFMLQAGRLANGPGYLDVSVSTRIDELKQRAAGQVSSGRGRSAGGDDQRAGTISGRG